MSNHSTSHKLFQPKKLIVVLAALVACGGALLTSPHISDAQTATPTAAATPTYPTLTAQEFFIGGGVTSVAFSPDEKMILTGSARSDPLLLDAVTGDIVRSFPVAGTNTIWHVEFSRDGKRVLAAGGDSAQVWNAATGTHIATFRVPYDFVSDAAFSPDGKTVLITGSRVNTATLWQTTTARRLRTFDVDPADLSNPSEMVDSVAFSPDGKMVMLGGDNHNAWLWDAATGKLLRTLTLDSESSVMGSVAFSPDSQKALTGSDDGNARLWDIATGALLRTFSGHLGAISRAVFSPDGKYVLTGSADRTAVLWDAATGKALQTFTSHGQGIYDVAFSPDGRYILLGNTQGTARLVVLDTSQ